MFEFAVGNNYKWCNYAISISADKSLWSTKAAYFNGAVIKPNIHRFEEMVLRFVDGSTLKGEDKVIVETRYKLKIDTLADKKIKKKYFHPRFL